MQLKHGQFYQFDQSSLEAGKISLRFTKNQRKKYDFRIQHTKIGNLTFHNKKAAFRSDEAYNFRRRFEKSFL